MSSTTMSAPIPVPCKRPAPSLFIGAGSNPYDRSILAKSHSQFFKMTTNKWLSKTHPVDGFTIAFRKRDIKEDDMSVHDWARKLSEPESPFSPEDDKESLELSSAYFLKKTYMLPSPVEDTYEIDKHIAVTEQHRSRLNAFSVCKSLLSQRLRRLKSAAVQGGAMTGPQTEEPVQNAPRRRPALKTIYRAPEDICGYAVQHIPETPATPRLNNFEPRFEGPEIAENRLLPSLSVKSAIIRRNSVITPTKQLPANVSLRRTVVFRPSPLRQVFGVVDLQRSGPEIRDGQEESADPERSQRESVPGFEIPVQQRRRSGDLMVRVIQKEFRREVLERRRKRLAAQTEAEAAPVQTIPRKGSAEA